MSQASEDQTLEDRLNIIRENLKAGSAHLIDVSGSFRVDFPAGSSVYIYPETFDNTITARFETKSADSGMRRREADQVRDELDREIGFADIPAFQESQALKNRFVYTAKVNIEPSVFFHETIVIGSVRTISDEASGTRSHSADAPTLEAIEPEVIDFQSLAEEAVGRLETIDTKMLRLSLDMMNLKRSSAVRAALTRIFRDAIDADELIRAIDNEAGKLTSPNELEELAMVRAINNDEALEPVIRLLHGRVLSKKI